MTPLNILHVFRAPVGGLFRHVLDLAREQIARGHRVGLIADSNTGGARAEEILRELAPSLALGLTRVPMRRHIGPSDALVLAPCHAPDRRKHAPTWCTATAPKAAPMRAWPLNARRAVRAYTPHGGSLLFGHDTLAGKFYLATEKLLMLRGDLFLFESAYSAEVFRRKIGTPRGPRARRPQRRVAKRNSSRSSTRADASDLVFMGEFRPVKGIDVLIDAIAQAASRRARRHRNAGRRRARARPVASAGRASRSGRCRPDFKPAMPAREAQTLGRIMVIPSRAESLPYVVLEAAAAGMPLITTKVGGIPEIYGPLTGGLVAAEDVGALADASHAPSTTPTQPRRRRGACASALRPRFRSTTMVDGVLDAYANGARAAAATWPPLRHFCSIPISFF